MPQIRSKQILGQTPINPNDIVNKKYVDDLFASGGTGGGAINIEDEGNLVLSGATILNFIGVDVRAQSALSGTTRRVNIYIPPPDYVSHFNTNDGTSNAIVSPISTTNRYISLPTTPGSPFNIGDWVGGEIHPTIRNSVVNLVYSPVGLISIYDLTTTFTATVYGADGTTILSTHTLLLNGDNTVTLNNITITISNFGVDADRYSSNISVSIAINSILGQGGRFSVSLTHNNSTNGTYIFTQNNIFRDSETLTSNIGGLLTILPMIPVIKQISGVYSYTLNSEWHVNLPNIDNLNSRSYPTTPQLIIDDNDLIYTSEVLNVNGEGGIYYGFKTGTWTQQHNTIDAEFDKLDWTTDIQNQTNWNHSIGTINTPVATGRIYDWALTGTVNSSTYNYLIDTLVDLSDRNSEMFRSETTVGFPRLQSDLITPWDSTVKLNLIDGGTGLQVLGDRLVYPQFNFQTLNPNSGTSQPNYTPLTGDRYYYRRFNTNGFNVSNGIIQFGDHNLLESDLSSGGVIFEISIDNGINWYTLSNEYDGTPLTDGDGCRVDSSDYGLGAGTISSNSLRFTLGLGGSSTFVHLKITIKSSASSKYIGSIDFIDGNWI
jgi:hypothetical protein